MVAEDRGVGRVVAECRHHRLGGVGYHVGAVVVHSGEDVGAEGQNVALVEPDIEEAGRRAPIPEATVSNPLP